MGLHEPAPRAKLFAPFDALNGLTEELKEQEQLPVTKRELSEESREELDRSLQQIFPGDMVTTVYFYHGAYRKLTGIVEDIDTTCRILKIGEVLIPADDISELVRL